MEGRSQGIMVSQDVFLLDKAPLFYGSKYAMLKVRINFYLMALGSDI